MSKKQVIVVRKDLNMRKGKMVAQGAHASMKAILDLGFLDEPANSPVRAIVIYLTDDLSGWLDGSFKKICVSVDSEEELDAVYAVAEAQNIPRAMITDSGLTEFHGVPTKTCCAIGPAEDEIIDLITGQLKLL